jgi:hypothetical protein
MSIYDGGDILPPAAAFRAFDCGTKNYWRGWNVRDQASGRVTFVPTEGTLSSAIIAIEHSPDSFTWHAFDTPVSLDAAEDTGEIDLSNVNFLRARTDTAQAGVKGYLALAAKPRTLIKG